jgi:anthranilate phosphoribosyltransferase
MAYPKAYHDVNSERSKQADITAKRIATGSELNKHDIENTCKNEFVSRTYYDEAGRKDNRDGALEMAAQTVVDYGREIKGQLDANETSVPSEQNNQKADASRISGGTMSKIMEIITKIMSGKTGDEHQAAADNFSAMIEVLAEPENAKKFAEVMEKLAQNPILVADIQSHLYGTKGGKIFDQAIEHLHNNQKTNIYAVTPEDLAMKRQENAKELEKSAKTAAFSR